MSPSKKLCLERIESSTDITIPDLSLIIFQYIRHIMPEYIFEQQQEKEWQFSPIIIGRRGGGMTTVSLNMVRFGQMRTIGILRQELPFPPCTPKVYFPLCASLGPFLRFF